MKTPLSAESSGTVCVRTQQHPFCAERVTHKMAAGASVSEIVTAAGAGSVPQAYMQAYLDGHFIPPENWTRLRPHAGTVLTLRMVPRGGGGGKNPLRTVLSLALVAASPMIAGAVAGALGVTAQTALMGISAMRVITAGVNILGRLALNAIAPPGQARFGAGQKESATLFLQGARNRVTPFGRVPKVLGRHRFVPPLGAMPYTETIGNDQYLRMIFIWGYGPLNITNLRIGETPLSEFEGVEIETRSGYLDDAPLTLYSNSVLQNDMEVVLREADGYVMRTADSDADEISVDITLPRGLVAFNGAGKKILTDVRIEVQYSPAGANDWSAGGSSFKAVPPQTVLLADMPAPYRYMSRIFTVSRTDRIVMDAASGIVRVIKGEEYRIGHDSSAPALPAVPDGYLAIARVERRSDDSAVIPPARVTDERAAPLSLGLFENGEDFAAAPSASAHRVLIAAGGLKFAGLYLSAKQSSAIRAAVKFNVPRGRYDVRVRRITEDSDSDRVFNDTVWTALRTVRYSYPVAMRGVAMTAVRIKATDQMNGIIDRFNGIVESIVPDWNGETWSERPTSNPAALYRHVLQGNANARPLADHRIDIERLQEWHAVCAANGREYNAVIDYDTSVREVLQDIAAAGRASPTLGDGKWGVVEDKPRITPVQHFSPRNTWGFEGRKAFDDIPDGLRVRFINRDKDWAQDERLVFRDGTTADTARRYETITLPGITDPVQAWRDGRYHLASAVLRPETYSFSCDIEHLVCTRGDLVRFTHDVPMFGICSARIKSVITAPENPDIIRGALLDEPIQMEEDKAYCLRVRRTDGTSAVFEIETNTEAASEVIFSAPQTQDVAAIAPGDLVLFGESGRESILLIVRAIVPQGDLAARLTCVDAAPELHLADNGVIPAWSNQATLPASLRRPPMPRISTMTAEVVSNSRADDIRCRLRIGLQAAVYHKELHVRAEIRAKDESFFIAADMTQNGVNIIIDSLSEGETYDIRLRYMAGDGIFSAPFLMAGYRVDALGAAPANIAGLSMNVLGSAAYLSWPAVSGDGISHYTLRFNPAVTGAAWNNAIDLVPRIPQATTSIAIPALVGTFLIKAVDLRGRTSEEAAIAVSGIAGLNGYNAVETIDEAAAFAGSHDRTMVDSGSLQLAIGETYGTYHFAAPADLGAVYTSLVSAAVSANGIDRAESVDEWENNDQVENRDGNADPASWGVRLQLRTTIDDPADAPVWSDWQDFSIGEYTARAFECRIILQAETQTITPVIHALSLQIDMPDRTDAARNITAPADGIFIAFAPKFRVTPAVAITAQNMQSGDYYSLTDISPSGFHIRFFNSGGSGAVRQFDWLAKGYGAEG